MKVSVPTQDTIKTISVKTPITSSGKPMDTATPTCLIGPKPAELLLRLCLSLTADYSRSPAASRAWSSRMKIFNSTIFPSRTLNTNEKSISTSTPLCLPRPPVRAVTAT